MGFAYFPSFFSQFLNFIYRTVLILFWSILNGVTLKTVKASVTETELFENQRNLKLSAFGFHVDWKHLKTEFFEDYDF